MLPQFNSIHAMFRENPIAMSPIKEMTYMHGRANLPGGRLVTPSELNPEWDNVSLSDVTMLPHSRSSFSSSRTVVAAGKTTRNISPTGQTSYMTGERPNSSASLHAYQANTHELQQRRASLSLAIGWHKNQQQHKAFLSPHPYTLPNIGNPSKMRPISPKKYSLPCARPNYYGTATNTVAQSPSMNFSRPRRRSIVLRNHRPARRFPVTPSSIKSSAETVAHASTPSSAASTKLIRNQWQVARQNSLDSFLQRKKKNSSNHNKTTALAATSETVISSTRW